MKKLTFNKKSAALVLAGMMLVCGVAGGTLAWLTDETEEVTNTFTESNIGVTLTETTGNEYKMIPGWTIEKDPVVTVKAGSEDCWVFLEVKEENDLNKFISYTIDPNNWTKLNDEENVYYCKVTDVTADRKIKVLGYTDGSGEFHSQQVLVNGTVKKEDMEKLLVTTYPKLEFTAYAVQLWKTNEPEANAPVEEILAAQFTPEDAWGQAKPQESSEPEKSP